VNGRSYDGLLDCVDLVMGGGTAISELDGDGGEEDSDVDVEASSQDAADRRRISFACLPCKVI